jgi:DNA-binding NarL/FixJ family response regulator
LNPEIQTVTRLLLVDDHPIVRVGIALLLNMEPDLRVAWEALGFDEAVTVCQSAAPDMAVIDIALGQESGIELIRKLARLHPAMPMLALSMHDEALYGERALRAGARGYVMKHNAAKEIVAALRRIRAGDIHVSEALRTLMAEKPGKRSSGIDQLSERELEVFRLIGLGLRKSELADRLKLSVNTIETHRAHLKKKLNVGSCAQLAKLAISHLKSERDG